jgi:hypothetical protein
MNPGWKKLIVGNHVLAKITSGPGPFEPLKAPFYS